MINDPYVQELLNQDEYIVIYDDYGFLDPDQTEDIMDDFYDYNPILIKSSINGNIQYDELYFIYENEKIYADIYYLLDLETKDILKILYNIMGYSKIKCENGVCYDVYDKENN